MASTSSPAEISLILVGIDGSDNSCRALDWAVGLAERVDAEVLAVHALGLLDQLTPDEVTEAFESRWCAALDASTIGSHRRVVDGPPSMALLRVADEEPVDLIVVGTRGVGGYTELLLGSTSLNLIQHAAVPVTVIPAP